MNKLKKILKDHFIPHEENGHRPHFLRFPMVVKVLGAVTVLEVLFLSQILIFAPTSDFFAAILKDVLISYANESRVTEHLNTLSINPLLSEAAGLKAEDMAKKGYFAHHSPEGLSPWHWFSEVGYKFNYAGENLAVNFVDSYATHEAWMSSPLHRANIMHNKFTEIGIGTAEGIYKGKEAIFVVQLFASPTASRPTETQVPPDELDAELIADEEVLDIEPIVEEETFIQLTQNDDKDNEPVVLAAVEGGSASGGASLAERIISAPNTIMNIIFGAVLALVLFALLLKVFVKMHIQHPALIANGVLMAVALVVLLVANHELIYLSGVVN